MGFCSWQAGGYSKYFCESKLQWKSWKSFQFIVQSNSEFDNLQTVKYLIKVNDVQYNTLYNSHKIMIIYTIQDVMLWLNCFVLFHAAFIQKRASTKYLVWT